MSNTFSFEEAKVHGLGEEYDRLLRVQGWPLPCEGPSEEESPSIDNTSMTPVDIVTAATSGKLTTDQLEVAVKLQQAFPGLVRDDGSIDLLAMAVKSTRLSARMQLQNTIPPEKVEDQPSALRKPEADHYIPQPDEPSPFGGARASWMEWKRQQPGAIPGDDTYGMQCDALKARLEKEEYRTLVHRNEHVPCIVKTPDGLPTLGYVIHIRYSDNVSWREAHDYAVSMCRNTPSVEV